MQGYFGVSGDMLDEVILTAHVNSSGIVEVNAFSTEHYGTGEFGSCVIYQYFIDGTYAPISFDWTCQLSPVSDMDSMDHFALRAVVTRASGDVMASDFLYIPDVVSTTAVSIPSTSSQLYTREEDLQIKGDFAFLGFALLLVLVLNLGVNLFRAFRAR